LTSKFVNKNSKIPFHVTYFNFSAAMEEHRATCEAEGRYVEAEMARNRINELRE